MWFVLHYYNALLTSYLLLRLLLYSFFLIEYSVIKTNFFTFFIIMMLFFCIHLTSPRQIKKTSWENCRKLTIHNISVNSSFFSVEKGKQFPQIPRALDWLNQKNGYILFFQWWFSWRESVTKWLQGAPGVDRTLKER